MSHTLNWLLSASLAFGSTAFLLGTGAAAAENDNASSNAQQNDQMSSGQSMTSAAPQLPNGAKQAQEQTETSALTAPIAAAANAAMSKNGLDSMVGNFVDQDRNRLSKIDEINADKLNGRIEQLQQAWKDKYQQDFDAKPENFASVQSVTGQIDDPQQFVQNWPLSLVKGNGAQQAAAHSDALNDETRTQGNIEKGRDVAVVNLPAENGLPAMSVSLIGEAGGWKIDVPNDRTAQQIHDDVLTQLTVIGNNTAKLPADAQKAQAVVSRRVLAAIYGTNLPQADQNQNEQSQ